MFSHRISYDFNPKVGNLTINYENHAVDDAVVNVTFNLLETVLSMKIHLRVQLPEDENDRIFQKELLKTSIDVGKVFSGISGNFFVKSVVDSLLKSFEFEAKFPFRPVNIDS